MVHSPAQGLCPPLPQPQMLVPNPFPPLPSSRQGSQPLCLNCLTGRRGTKLSQLGVYYEEFICVKCLEWDLVPGLLHISTSGGSD